MIAWCLVEVTLPAGCHWTYGTLLESLRIAYVGGAVQPLSLCLDVERILYVYRKAVKIMGFRISARCLYWEIMHNFCEPSMVFVVKRVVYSLC